jgi:hypothetical protein
MPEPKRRSFTEYLAIYGCFSTALIYFSIGVIAILSFLRLKEGGADEGSLFVFLDRFMVGKIFVWIIMSGSLSYIIWRIYEAITDPYEYGNNSKAILLRVGIALSTIADMLITFSAIEALLGIGNIQENGVPKEQREIAAQLLQHSYGRILIISIAVIIIITAIAQLIYGLSRSYEERLHFEDLKPNTKKLIHLLANIGYVARGIIIGIIGFFLLKAGTSSNGEHVVNTDKAFDFIGDHVGHVWFILVAIGTSCYGVFMFILGLKYDPD